MYTHMAPTLVRKQPLHRNVQRFRGGLVFEAHKLCVSLNSTDQTPLQRAGCDYLKSLPGMGVKKAHQAIFGTAVCSSPTFCKVVDTICKVVDTICKVVATFCKVVATIRSTKEGLIRPSLVLQSVSLPCPSLLCGRVRGNISRVDLQSHKWTL